MLKFDLLGIGIMIFTLCVTCVYAGYHAHEVFRNCIMGTMISIFVSNLIIQSMPCYKRIDNDCLPTCFYVSIVVLCLGLAISWVCYFATEEEIREFAIRLAMSFIYLFIGFFFFHTGYPERVFQESRVVQLYMNSHMLWHIFTFLNGYALYWLLYDFQIFNEKNAPAIVKN